MEIINKQIEITGLTVSPGIAIGEVCHYQSGTTEQTAIYKITAEQTVEELERFNKALETSKSEIRKLLKSIEENVGVNEAKIFESHLYLLEDQQLLDKIVYKVKNENLNIEFAVKSVFEEFEEIFDNMKDEYLRERKLDFSELKKRLLSHLSGEEGKFLCRHQCLAHQKKGRIILTKELTPSMVNLLENNNIMGFVTQTGGKNSHAALLARSIGIPYITGISFIDKIKCETKVIIDGNSEKVIFNPSEEVLHFYNNLYCKEKGSSKINENKSGIIKTLKDKEIKLYANIINFNDIDMTKKHNLSGLGLVRTEFLFLASKNFPSEEEQFQVYSEIIKRYDGREITFRLFDFGGDKTIPSLIFSKEENPLLGMRGIRYLLKYKKILTDQIRAIARCASLGKIKILYPMISTLEELEETNDIFNNIVEELNIKTKIEKGMMFEVPSVFIKPKDFIKEVDFISIGTNDLVQYLFGIDRNNLEVSYLYNQDNPAVYALLKKTVAEAKKEKKGITLCGEIDLNTNFLESIIKLGITRISISPLSAPKIIDKIRSINA
jgi:phosphoenolpyruvate-protein phosphotransferase (PTS system enzyme I)